MRTELVTSLKRKATELLSELSRDKEPILITQHDLPSAYLVDVDSFEYLQGRIKFLEGIARGERAVQNQASLKVGIIVKLSNRRVGFFIAMMILASISRMSYAVNNGFGLVS